VRRPAPGAAPGLARARKRAGATHRSASCDQYLTSTGSCSPSSAPRRCRARRRSWTTGPCSASPPRRAGASSTSSAQDPSTSPRLRAAPAAAGLPRFATHPTGCAIRVPRNSHPHVHLPGFCTCASYHHKVVGTRPEAICCKHELASKLAEALQRCEEVAKDDVAWASHLAHHMQMAMVEHGS